MNEEKSTKKWIKYGAIVFSILLIVGMATTDTQSMPDNAVNNYNTAVAVSSNSVLENITENNVIEDTNTTENTISNTVNTNETENEISKNTVIENIIDVENTVIEDKETNSVENTTIEKETEAKTTSQKKASEPSVQASSTQTQETKPATTQTRQAPVTTPNSATVYITDTGSKYHRDGCQYLRKSKHAISLDSATSQGYSPCSRCY